MVLVGKKAGNGGTFGLKPIINGCDQLLGWAGPAQWKADAVDDRGRTNGIGCGNAGWAANGKEFESFLFLNSFYPKWKKLSKIEHEKYVKNLFSSSK